jgi:hypothetical protein
MDLCLILANARRDYVSQYEANQSVIERHEARLATPQLNVSQHRQSSRDLSRPPSSNFERNNGNIGLRRVSSQRLST